MLPVDLPAAGVALARRRDLKMVEQLMTRYPTVADLRRRARKRIPHFAWEYLDSGTGAEDCLARNERAFGRVVMIPRFMQGVFEPDVSTSLFGIDYAAPFGIAPVGMTGLMWPGIESILAATAARYRIPLCVSTFATETPEAIAANCGGMGWFQLYPPRDTELRRELLQRARNCGYTALLVTADVPIGSRRERQRRAGVSVPPRITPRTLYHCALRPAWSLATLRHGLPRFRGLEQYVDAADMQFLLDYIGREFGGTLDWEYLEALRGEWDGPLLVKGLLDVGQAEKAAAIGLDGVVVSNHGGRQFDAAPAALDVLPAIKAAVGGEMKIVFDSGVRSGLDVLRALALGADFVLLGRAFIYGIAALGGQGGDHVADILLDDLRNNMIQLGCRGFDELGERVAHSG